MAPSASDAAARTSARAMSRTIAPIDHSQSSRPTRVLAEEVGVVQVPQEFDVLHQIVIAFVFDQPEVANEFLLAGLARHQCLVDAVAAPGRQHQSRRPSSSQDSAGPPALADLCLRLSALPR